MLLSPLGLFHEFFRFIFIFSGLNIRLMTQLEQPQPTMQTCFSTKCTCPVLNALRADTPFCLEYPPEASARGRICETKMAYLSQGLSNRAGARVTSRKVVRAERTRGGYNLSSIFSYSKGFKIVTSLI
jgi:hypothetical protein